MQFLNDYMSASERENAIFEAQMNRESIALDNKFSSLMQEHALRLSDIDLSVALERYSDDSTQALFEREMAIYMEGVKEWWAEFKKWFSNLINKLCGKTTPDVQAGLEAAKNDPGKVTLPCDVDEVVKGGESVLDKIKNFFKYKKDDGSLDVGKIAAEAGGAAVVSAMLGIGGVKLADTFKEKEYDKKDLPPLWERILAFFKKADSTVKDIKDDTPEGKSIKDVIMKVFQPIKDILAKVKNAIVGLVKKDKPEGSEDPKADSNGEATDENKTVSDADLKKAKQDAKAEILAQAKKYNISDPKKGNKVTLADLNDYITKLEAKYKEKNIKEFLDKVPGWKKAIKDWEDKGYTEFTIDDEIHCALPVFEAMAPIDDAIIDRELMLMTESEEADVAEFIDLVDSL